MKHRIIISLAALLYLVAAFAGNFQVENVTMKPGEMKDLQISLAATVTNVAGVQFDVTIPEELVFESINSQIYRLSAGQPNDMTCNVSCLAANTYRFVLYSSSLQKLQGGELLNLNLKAQSAAPLGKYTISFAGIAFSDIDGKVTKESGVNATANVTNVFKLTYKVDGVDYKNISYDYGANITAEPAPTKEGYTFSGWSDIPETMPAHDVTITGSFSINKYKLIYQVDGVEYKNYEIEFGKAITPETAPTKEGHTFSGWSTIPETMPAHDVTVTGTFSKGKYKITYKVDGTDYKTISYDYGANITAEPAPTKEGYTFSGWSDIPETMPAHDVTITGSFSINKYKLIYQVDGVEYKNYEIEFGKAITPETAPTKEGHTFSGWSTIPETMPAHDVTVTGTFSKGKYKITYKVDGTDYKTISYDYGANITAEPAPTKEGYTFSGWSDIPETMPAHDVTITGSFSINKYKLIYQVDGVEYKNYEIEFGKAITPETAPTKEGHTFSGWSTIPETMPAHDVTVTGAFSKNTYKLTYKVDGVDYKNISYDYGANITAEPAPTKEGYTFSGWSEIPATMPAHDVTITGSFSINKYKLIYQVDGVEYKNYEVEYGASITAEAAPTKEGHTFSGWSTIPETMPAHDVTVTGAFSKNTYKLTYKVDGVDYKNISYDYGANITAEPAPTKEGYTFSGWSEIPATMPAHDVTVEGSFTVNKYKLVYQVDGEEYKSYDVEYGTAITPEPSPTKEGYTFSGWSTIPETMPAEDVTVTGTFAVNKYKLVYKVDGAEYKSYEIEYGKAITAEPVPSKEGYTFSGWSTIPETMPAHDVTVTGTFSINKYKLVYMVDGEVYKSYDVEYGATITAETAPTKEGFEFSGWSDIPETMPANDVTVTGTFKAIVKADDATIEVSGGEASVTGGETATGDVDIPESVSVNGVSYPVTTISDGAYQNNANITSATIPESVTTIGANAFNGCSNLGEVNVGKSVSNIGSKAFANLSAPAAARRAKTRGASGLVIKCYVTSVPTTAADAFENTSIGNATLLVDDNSVTAYKSASPWSGFGTIMGFSEATGINGVLLDNGDHAKVFSIDGKPLNTLQKGINIIRMDNGKTKKVLVR